MTALLPPTDFELGMAAGQLLIASSQAQHHLAGLSSAVSSINAAISAGARPTAGTFSPKEIADVLRVLAAGCDVAAARLVPSNTRNAA